MLAVDIFEYPAKLLAAFYALTSSYAMALALIGVVVILILTPLNLKQTKGMLEMQMLQPKLKRLQAEHRGDRQKFNEEMMKLYQEHKVNPLNSCLPLLAQMPVFWLMFSLIRGLTRTIDGKEGFQPKYLSESSELFKSLQGKTEMLSFGLDLSKSPAEVLGSDFLKGLIYAVLIVFLGFLYYVQQRMIANRAVSPTMNEMQAKIMQYLPVVFAVFQIFLPTGLVIYYVAQTVLRILQQSYITKRFYKGDSSLGKQAAEASAEARAIAGDSAKKLGTAGKTAGRGGASKPGLAKADPNRRVDGRPVNPGRPGAHKSSGGQGGTQHAKPKPPATRPSGPSRHPKPKSK